jgi:hypothetical protein
MLAPDTIPLPCKEVVSRVEPGGALLFQVRTDEMFFVSPGAFSLFSLCDGSRTIAEIHALLAHYQPELASQAGHEQVERFLESLAERRLVELWR